MNKKNSPVMYFTIFVAAASLLFSGYLLFVCQSSNSMNIYCSTILQLAQKDPDLSATLDLTFRLQRNHTGQVALSGNIQKDGSSQVISRSMLFDYEIENPDEVSFKNMRYAKNLKDTASDEDFKMNFFYVPEGQKRTIKIHAIQNAYLIENVHSPVFLCVNKR